MKEVDSKPEQSISLDFCIRQVKKAEREAYRIGIDYGKDIGYEKGKEEGYREGYTKELGQIEAMYLLQKTSYALNELELPQDTRLEIAEAIARKEGIDLDNNNNNYRSAHLAELVMKEIKNRAMSKAGFFSEEGEKPSLVKRMLTKMGLYQNER